MDIGKRIKKIRTEKGLTQKQLGEMLGSSQQMVAQYENGKHSPKLDTLNKIIEVLEIELSDLLDDEERQKYYAGNWIHVDKHSNIELFPPHEDDIRSCLLSCYDELNYTGKKEAFKRVGELTEIWRYVKPEKLPEE